MSASKLQRTLFPFLSWTPLLNGETVRADIMAGIAAGVLILPQAIALATLAGLPPEIGLYTAIFPVILCALFGSSWHSLSGPNTSISVMVAMILAGYATDSTPLFITYAITMTFMAGCIQLVFGFLRLGGIFNYFSHTIMMALVIGVGMIIIIQQLGDFLGLTAVAGEPVEDTLMALPDRLGDANRFDVILGTLTVGIGLLVKKYLPKWPFIIVATVTGLFAGWVLQHTVMGDTHIDKLGYLSLSALPLSAPDFSPQNFYEAAEGLIMGSFIIAFLGLMQSAVIARAIAVKSGQIVNLNTEVVGQAISNIGGSFLSCYPSCGSFNRSAANFEAGGRTPLTGIISAVVLAGMVAIFAPWLAHLPISVVASVLILVGWGLIDIPYLKKTLRIRGETRIVFLLTLFVTVYGGLEWGVMLGIALSVIVYLRSVSVPEYNVLDTNEAHQYLPDGIEDEDATVLH
ncbi:MAG: sodium-independent anion transporter, partial [Gammaproteobacteria bacterium]|nr:sodium-independent anion transporter [Gammaproteobacteria bacterium]